MFSCNKHWPFHLFLLLFKRIKGFNFTILNLKTFLFLKIKYMTQNVCKLLGQQLALIEFLFGPRNYSLCLGIQ